MPLLRTSLLMLLSTCSVRSKARVAPALVASDRSELESRCQGRPVRSVLATRAFLFFGFLLHRRIGSPSISSGRIHQWEPS